MLLPKTCIQSFCRNRYGEAFSASLACAQDPAAARDLLELMSSMSEDAYCACWIIDNEYELWCDVTSLRAAVPHRGWFATEHLAQLSELSLRCGGWWHWGDSHGALFISIPEWEQLYNKAGITKSACRRGD